MTNDNYMDTDREKVVSEIQLLRKEHRTTFKTRIQNNHELNEFILQSTSFLPLTASYDERIYCVLNDIRELQICPTCQKNALNFMRLDKGYTQHCSTRCSSLDEKVMEKTKQTCRTNLGVDHPFQSSEVQKKIKQSLMEHFGVENPSYSPKVIEKIKQTTMNHYGVECSFQSDEVKQKIKQTCQERYGVSHYNKCDESKLRHKLTCNKIYGFDSPAQSPEIKQKIIETNKIKYGGNSPSCSKDVLEKIRKTTKEHFGVEHYAWTDDFKKTHRNIFTNPKYENVTFDSSWEFKVYDFLTEHNIPFEYQPNVMLEYEFDGRHHRFHPDFLVDGRLYEVKGEQFFRINEFTGQEEMFNPYRNIEWSNERYDYECAKYEAKHQCMIANNVRILRKKDIDNLEQVFM